MPTPLEPRSWESPPERGERQGLWWRTSSITDWIQALAVAITAIAGIGLGYWEFVYKDRDRLTDQARFSMDMIAQYSSADMQRYATTIRTKLLSMADNVSSTQNVNFSTLEQEAFNNTLAFYGRISSCLAHNVCDEDIILDHFCDVQLSFWTCLEDT